MGHPSAEDKLRIRHLNLKLREVRTGDKNLAFFCMKMIAEACEQRRSRKH